MEDNHSHEAGARSVNKSPLSYTDRRVITLTPTPEGLPPRAANLTEPGVVADLFDQAEKEIGPVDVLVNNAADYQADTFVPPQSLGK